jgi:hypothetical protein
MSRKKRLTRDEQVAVIQEALSGPLAKQALIEARNAKKKRPEEQNDFRDAFADFWAKNKKAYGKAKDLDLEVVLWLHLKAVGCDHPDKFVQGIENFGLKK